MLAEVLAAIAPSDGQLIVDGTFGAGGYSRAILDAAQCRVHALDRDVTAVRAAAAICVDYPNRLIVTAARFSTLDEVIRIFEERLADAVVLDIGVSSMQLDQPERGFSFQTDGPLDMRMSAEGLSAADVVNTASADELADIFFHLGDE